MNNIVHLVPSQVKPASAMLCRAFFHDPLVRCILPAESRRAHALPTFYRIAVRYALRYGEVYTTAGVEGAACWLAPGNTTLSTWRLLRVAISMPLSFSLAEQRRDATVARYTASVHARAVSGPHWYLWVLGVEPARQHQGLGSRLIQPILARADSDGLPCYLETMTEANVPFYAKHGFAIAHEGVVPGTELRVWGMRRG